MLEKGEGDAQQRYAILSDSVGFESGKWVVVSVQTEALCP